MSGINLFETSPQNIMHAYKMAILEAKKANDYDAEITAYRKVIDYCSNTSECRLDSSIRRQVLLRWAHEKIAEAYWRKKDAENALMFYEGSFNLSRNLREQNVVLGKMGEVYWESGAMDKWFDVREKIASNLDKNEKRAAYLVLANEAVEEYRVIDYLERALEATGQEDGALNERMNGILDISTQLITLYRFRKDFENLQRVERLQHRVKMLQQKISPN